MNDYQKIFEPYFNSEMSYPKDLTTNIKKYYLYGIEPCFRQSWFDIQNTFLKNTLDELHSIGLILVKPEAIATHQFEAINRMFYEHKLYVYGYQSITLNPHMLKELWRYQLNSGTRERMQFIEYYADGQKALALFVKKNAPTKKPLSVALTEIKGHTLVKNQKKGELRSYFKQRHTLLNNIHTSDSVIDLVRDFGILLSRLERLDVLKQIKGRNKLTFESLSFYKPQKHTLSLDIVLDKIKKEKRLKLLDPDSYEILTNYCHADFCSKKLYNVVPRLKKLGIFSNWDLVTLLAHDSPSTMDDGVPAIFDSNIYNKKK